MLVEQLPSDVPAGASKTRRVCWALPSELQIPLVLPGSIPPPRAPTVGRMAAYSSLT